MFIDSFSAPFEERHKVCIASNIVGSCQVQRKRVHVFYCLCFKDPMVDDGWIDMLWFGKSQDSTLTEIDILKSYQRMLVATQWLRIAYDCATRRSQKMVVNSSQTLGIGVQNLGRCNWWVFAACLTSWRVLMVTGHGALHCDYLRTGFARTMWPSWQLPEPTTIVALTNGSVHVRVVWTSSRPSRLHEHYSPHVLCQQADGRPKNLTEEGGVDLRGRQQGKVKVIVEMMEIYFCLLLHPSKNRTW